MKLPVKLYLSEIINLPNLISLFRLLLVIPLYFTISMINVDNIYRVVSIVLIIIAFISDLLDGFFARKKKLITELGKIIDPLADKVLVIVIITLLYLHGFILDVYFWIIVLRDVIIFTGGIFISNKIGKVLPSNMVGKITVLSISIYILIILLNIQSNNIVYHIFFYLSLILSFLSVILYVIRAIEALRWGRNEIIE